MPASLGTVPVALVPPFGAVPRPSTFAAQSRGLNAYDSLVAQDARINYCLNPSFEYDLSGWLTYNNASPSRSTTQAVTGSASCYVVAGNTTGSQGILGNWNLPQGGNQYYSASCYIRNDIGTRTWYIILYFYDAQGKNLVNYNTQTTTVSSTGWTRIGGSWFAPQNTAYCTMYIAMVSAGAATDAGYIDGVLIERSTYGGGAYFDGDSAGGAWAGAGGGDATGNLLTANQASMETDASAWTNNSGTTVALSSAQALFGTNSLLVTFTGAGSAQIKTSGTNIPITPGIPYTMAAHVRGSVGARSTNVGFYWFRANGTSIGSSVTTVDSQKPTSLTEWRRYSATAIPPAEATSVQPFILFNTGSVSDAVYVDGVGFWQGSGGAYALPGAGPIANLGAGQTISTSAAAATTRVNLVADPDATAVSNWFNNPTNGTLTLDTSVSWSGTSSIKHSSVAAGVAVSGGPRMAVPSTASSTYGPASEGLPYTYSVYLKADRPGMKAHLRIFWRSIFNINYSTSQSSDVDISDTVWTRVSFTATAPAGTYYVAVTEDLVDPSSVYPSGIAMWADGALLEQASSAGSWFSGDSVGASWSNYSAFSASVLPSKTAAGVTLARSVSDSLTTSDTTIARVALSRSIADALTLSDTVDGVYAQGAKTVSDSLTLTDTLASAVVTTRATNDAITATDSLTRSVAFTQTVADTLALTDTISSPLGDARAISDTLALSDAVTRNATRPRTVVDTITTADSLARSLTVSLAPAETLTLTETITATEVRLRSTADTLTLTDGLTRNTARLRSLADAVTLSETLNRATTRTRTFSATLTLSESLFVDVILATPPPVHAAGIGAGMSITGAKGSSQASGNTGRAEVSQGAGSVYPKGSANKVEVHK
jgi:hypothetical protein